MDRNFLYVVFQPIPKRDNIYYWMDGETTKRIMSIKAFTDLLMEKTPSLLSSFIDASHTYSFFMWDLVDVKIIHLTPHTSSEESKTYRDPIMLYVTQMGKGIDLKEKRAREADKQTTLEETLANIGFSMPNDDSIQNLKVAFVDRRAELPKNGFAGILRANIFKR